MLSRRSFLAALAVGPRREVFRRAPESGALMAYAFYTRATGGEMMSIEERWTRSDTIDRAILHRSRDHGRHWIPAGEIRTAEHVAGGMLRRHPRGWFPHNGRTLEFWIEGVLPNDDPLEGLKQWSIYYRADAGPAEKIPVPGVEPGRNCIMLADMACVPLAMPDGRVLLPVVLTQPGSDGKLYNPTGGYTWTEAAVLHGRWRDGRLVWQLSQPVKGDPARSTRGMDEPTLALLPDGRMLMVLRGSNDRKPGLPSYRWCALSEDGGYRWTEPRPWTYDDGEAFFSPSSCSQLLRHSSGRLFWIGNITPENPRGNRPRYPLVIGQVTAAGLLARRSIRVVDTLAPGEDPILSLSNFYAREDRATREIVVHMTRLFARPGNWSGDAFAYRISSAIP